MSEQNNEFKVSNKQPKPKKPFEKKFRVFVILLSIILIGVTAGLIVLKRNNIDVVPQGPLDLGKAPEAGELATTNLEPLNLTDKFYYNGIETETLRFSQNKIEGTDEYKFQCEYVQIDGLKNKTVQEKINQDLKTTAYDFYQKSQMEDESIRSIHVSEYVMGSFADILSVNLNYTIFYKDSSLDETYQRGLNYSLKDGEYIKFEDCFLETASVKKILTQASYKAFLSDAAQESAGIEYQESLDLSVVDYSSIERKTYEYIDYYNKNGIQDFCITTYGIYVYDNNGYLEILLEDIYEDVAIYTRFLKEKLYTNNREAKYFVFNSDMEEPYYDYMKLEKDNLYVELKIDFFEQYIEEGPMKDRALKLINEAKTKMLLKLEEYKQIADDNPEKGYILQMSYMPNVYDDETQDYIYGDIYEYNMEYEYFKENIFDIVAAAHRIVPFEYVALPNFAYENKNIKLKTTYDEIRLEPEEDEEETIENEVVENVIDNSIIENTVSNEVVEDENNTTVENIVEETNVVVPTNEVEIENVTE